MSPFSRAQFFRGDSGANRDRVAPYAVEFRFLISRRLDAMTCDALRLVDLPWPSCASTHRPLQSALIQLHPRRPGLAQHREPDGRRVVRLIAR